MRCLDQSGEGNWVKLVDHLLLAIDKDLTRHVNQRKRLNPELHEALHQVVLAAEACSTDGMDRRLENCAKHLYMKIYEALNTITRRETSTHFQCLDNVDEMKRVGRAYSRILLKLLEPHEYHAHELSPTNGELIMLSSTYFSGRCEHCVEPGKA